jgi:hypothetical protein
LGQNAETLHLLQTIEAQAGYAESTQAEGTQQQTCHQIGGDRRQIQKLGKTGHKEAADNGNGQTDQSGLHNITFFFVKFIKIACRGRQASFFACVSYHRKLQMARANPHKF